jgi:hypothetical protein
MGYFLWARVTFLGVRIARAGTEAYFIMNGEVEVEAHGVRLGYLSEGALHTSRLGTPGTLPGPQKIFSIRNIYRIYSWGPQ